MSNRNGLPEYHKRGDVEREREGTSIPLNSVNKDIPSAQNTSVMQRGLTGTET